MRSIATTRWLCWLTAFPTLAQENSPDDPLVGTKRLSERKKLLIDKDTSVRCRAARDLGKIGTHARSAVSALKELLDDPVSNVRADAKVAIIRIKRSPSGNRDAQGFKSGLD